MMDDGAFVSGGCHIREFKLEFSIKTQFTRFAFDADLFLDHRVIQEEAVVLLGDAFAD